jgi:hypothetical protein
VLTVLTTIGLILFFFWWLTGKIINLFNRYKNTSTANEQATFILYQYLLEENLLLFIMDDMPANY